MFDVFFKTLETLSRYGIIEILSAIGIFTYIPRLLERKVTSDIDHVDLVPDINVNHSAFILTIKNRSREPLYLYNANLKLGYNSESIDKSNFKIFLLTMFFRIWKHNSFQNIISQNKTTKGLYILQGMNVENEDDAPTLLIEPGKWGAYKLNLNSEYLHEIERPNEIFDKKQFGILELQFVHGAKSGQLEVQI